MQDTGGARSGPVSDPAGIRDTMLRICDSRVFRGAPTLRAFLNFVVEKTLAGDANSIKAYTVAVEALGRDPDFDPTSNSLVRVEAGRLRNALRRYYDSADDAIVISLPLGSYAPAFDWRAPPRHPDTGARQEARRIFAERLAHTTEFRRNLDQIQQSVAGLHADFARVRGTMAESGIVVARSRGTAGPAADAESEDAGSA